MGHRPMIARDAEELDTAQRALSAEASEFDRALLAKRPGMRAFVARAESPFIKSVVLAGSKEHGWQPIVACTFGDHRERAEVFAELYNARWVSNVEKKKEVSL